MRTLVVGVMYLAACGLPAQNGPSEPLAPLLLFQPTAADGSVAGGCAGAHGFLLERPGQSPLGLTAFHVAGPGAGAARLCSPLDPTVAIRLGRRLPVANARTIGSSGSQHDLAVFEVASGDPLRALLLADAMPAVGDTVWVLSVHHGAGGPGRHPARVAVSHDSAFVYAYTGSANTNGTSGAAVLDRDGRVVGVNVGTLIMSADGWQRFRDRYGPCCTGVSVGQVVGLAVGLRSLRTHLQQ